MIANFFKGVMDVKKGGSYILDNKSLIKIIIIPSLINIALFLLIGWFLIYNYGQLFDSISGGFLSGVNFNSEAWWAGIVKGLLWFLRGLIHMFFGVLIMGLTALVMLIVSQIINSPFYDLLSEAVEKNEMGLEDIPFSFKKLISELGRILLLELKKIGFFISIPVLLFLLNLIPVVGSLLYTILGNAFAGWAMGFNYLSYPMSRKLIPMKSQLGFTARHKARLIGFGLVVLIPFVNLILAPLFVVAGTLTYIELKGPGLTQEKNIVVSEV
jgi:CysZ protein